MVKEIKNKIVNFLLSSTLAISSMTGCGNNYDSIKLKQEYPELTEKRKSELEQKVLQIEENESKITLVNDENDNEKEAFSENLQEFVNHVLDFRKQDEKLIGLSYPGIEKTRLIITNQENINNVCGEMSMGCNQSNQIYMPDNLKLKDFLNLIYHEIGHEHHKGLREFVAVANELHLSLKTYQFNKPIGSLILENAFFSGSELNLEEYSPFHQMYLKAKMYTLHNLIEHNGDIEKAMSHLTNTKWLFAETDLKGKLSKIEGKNTKEQMFNLWDELLPKITSYLMGERGHLDDREAYELKEYLDYLNHLYYLTYDGNDEKKLEKLKTIERGFIHNGYGKNPYFLANITFDYSKRLIKEITDLGYDNYPEKYRKAKEIININSDYPCNLNDPYECPKIVRTNRHEQILGYYLLTGFANYLNELPKKSEAAYYTKEFINKYYPKIDFEKDSKEEIKNKIKNSMIHETNNYVPFLTFYAGRLKEEVKQFEEAEKFYLICSNISCLDDGVGSALECKDLQERCENQLKY